MTAEVQRIIDAATRHVGQHEVANWLAPDHHRYPTNSGPAVWQIQQHVPLKPETGWPWCMAAQECFRDEAGMPLPYRTASVGLWRAWGRAHGWSIVRPVPGAIVTFKFDHVGLVIAVHGSTLTTIEGNTSATGAVSDPSGMGCVARRMDRTLAQCDGFFLEPQLRNKPVVKNTWPKPRHVVKKAGTPKAKVIASVKPTSARVSLLPYQLVRAANGLVYTQVVERPH